jgi:hypothetical protein
MIRPTTTWHVNPCMNSLLLPTWPVSVCSTIATLSHLPSFLLAFLATFCRALSLCWCWFPFHGIQARSPWKLCRVRRCIQYQSCIQWFCFFVLLLFKLVHRSHACKIAYDRIVPTPYSIKLALDSPNLKTFAGRKWVLDSITVSH